MVWIIGTLALLLALILAGLYALANERRTALKLLATRPNLGWLGREIREAAGWSHWHSPYLALHSLEDDGLATSWEEPLSATSERDWIPRRRYRITEAGLQRVQGKS